MLRSSLFVSRKRHLTPPPPPEVPLSVVRHLTFRLSFSRDGIEKVRLFFWACRSGNDSPDQPEQQIPPYATPPLGSFFFFPYVLRIWDAFPHLFRGVGSLFIIRVGVVCDLILNLSFSSPRKGSAPRWFFPRHRSFSLVFPFTSVNFQNPFPRIENVFSDLPWE